MRHQGGVLATVVGSAGLYYVLSYSARHWSGDLSPSPLWLATAATTALALATPRRLRWPIIAGSALGLVAAGRILFDESWRGLVSPTVGNVVETILIVVAIDDVIVPDRRLRRTRDAVAVLGVIVAACAIGGLVAVTDTTSNVIGERFDSWWRWTLGDTVGELHLVGFVLTFRSGLINAPRGRVPWELVATIATIAAFGVLAFTVEIPLAFLLVPMVLWLAIRFGPVIASPVAFILALAATTASGRGYGPFIEFGPESVVQVQLFNIAIALCALVGGAHALRAQDDHERLVSVVSSLPDIVVFREQSGQVVSRWIPPELEASATLIEPSAAGARPPFDDEAAVPMRSLVSLDDHQVFEQRTVPVGERGRLELYRDVSTERKLDVARRRLEERALNARLAEQRRIGRALHDSPVQLLASALLQLELAMEDGAGSPRVAKAVELGSQSMRELRSTLEELIPPDVAAGEIVPALGSVGRLLLDDGIELHLVDTTLDPPLDPEVAEILFLAGREAIANAGLHASPANVTIALRQRSDAVELLVADDGGGVVPERPRRIGLTLMAERAEEVGGSLHIASEPGAGTEVRLRVPGPTVSS